MILPRSRQANEGLPRSSARRASSRTGRCPWTNQPCCCLSFACSSLKSSLEPSLIAEQETDRSRIVSHHVHESCERTGNRCFHSESIESKQTNLIGEQEPLEKPSSLTALLVFSEASRSLKRSIGSRSADRNLPKNGGWIRRVYIDGSRSASRSGSLFDRSVRSGAHVNASCKIAAAFSRCFCCA